jgi:hypothetical protein
MTLKGGHKKADHLRIQVLKEKEVCARDFLAHPALELKGRK